MTSEPSCSVCCFEFGAARPPILLICCGGHLCNHCLETIVDQAGAFCPFCRKKLTRPFLLNCQRDTPRNLLEILRTRQPEGQCTYHLKRKFDDGLGLQEEVIRHRRMRDETEEEHFRIFLSQNPSILREHQFQLEQERRIQHDEEVARQLQRRLEEETKDDEQSPNLQQKTDNPQRTLGGNTSPETKVLEARRLKDMQKKRAQDAQMRMEAKKTQLNIEKAMLLAASTQSTPCASKLLKRSVASPPRPCSQPSFSSFYPSSTPSSADEL